MSATFETLRVLKAAEEIADAIWKQVIKWNDFEKDTVGKQLARAADSIGANIAESFGRYHFGEKLQFLYYARGSIFETKFWLNRAKTRNLIPFAEVQLLTERITVLARQLNTFADSLKTVRVQETKRTKTLRETPASYEAPSFLDATLFDTDDLAQLKS